MNAGSLVSFGWMLSFAGVATRKITVCFIAFFALAPFVANASMNDVVVKNIAKSMNNNKIYLISHAGAGDPFWNCEFNGAKAAAKAQEVDLQIMAPERPNDIARQVELFNAALATRPKGIAMTIPDSRAFSKGLQEAKRLNITVVAFNARPDKKERSQNPYAAFVGMDEYEAGRTAAMRAIDSRVFVSRVLVPIHQPGHIGLEQRYKGIRDVFAEKKSQVVVDKIDITTDASRAVQLVRAYMQKHPKTEGVFCLGSSCNNPIGTVIEQFNKSRKESLYFAGFDLSPLTLRHIKRGTMAFSIDQQPYLQGYMSVTQLALHGRAKLSPANMNTGVGIVDVENVDVVKDLVRKGIR